MATKAKTKTLKNAKEIRATFIVDSEKAERLKAIAYYDRTKIKNVLDKAITDYLRQYTKENGEKYFETYKKSLLP
jgi:hypothetical protein